MLIGSTQGAKVSRFVFSRRLIELEMGLAAQGRCEVTKP